VPPASNEEAVTFFKRAIEIDPNHIEHYLELARTYEFMDKKELMREPLEKLLELPNVEEDDQKYKNEAGEMLKKL
jgi:tetratricopeptide (TPR) repeat protein